MYSRPSKRHTSAAMGAPMSEPRSEKGPLVYTASKTRHAPMWQAFRTTWGEVGVSVISTWIDEAGEGDSPDMADLWMRCISEAARADFLVCYYEDGDVWKGTFIEVGTALSHGKPVYLVANGPPPPGWSWVHHPLVTIASDPDDALMDFMGKHPRPEPEPVRYTPSLDWGAFPVLRQADEFGSHKAP